jgi:hypothetical protein
MQEIVLECKKIWKKKFANFSRYEKQQEIEMYNEAFAEAQEKMTQLTTELTNAKKETEQTKNLLAA